MTEIQNTVAIEAENYYRTYFEQMGSPCDFEVWKQAYTIFNAVDYASTYPDRVLIIARALQAERTRATAAERERCAKIADNSELECMEIADSNHDDCTLQNQYDRCAATSREIAAAIRNGDGNAAIMGNTPQARSAADILARREVKQPEVDVE